MNNSKETLLQRRHAYLEEEDGSLRPRLADMLFSKRPLLIVVFAILSAFFAYQASQLKPDASF